MAPLSILVTCPVTGTNVHWSCWLLSFSITTCGPQGVLPFAHSWVLGRAMLSPSQGSELSREVGGDMRSPASSSCHGPSKSHCAEVSLGSVTSEPGFLGYQVPACASGVWMCLCWNPFASVLGTWRCLWAAAGMSAGGKGRGQSPSCANTWMQALLRQAALQLGVCPGLSRWVGGQL